ncbi:MAG: glycosyltransferase [Planctomycetota bacterium]
MTDPADPARRLTWALVIATYNRPEVLARCLRCAVGQSRPPAEIVVIDGSDGWETSADAARVLVNEQQAPIALVYEPAAERSLTAQRNQGVERASADVLFMIDDDSLMYSDCAERVMEVFEHTDAEPVVGVVTALDSTPPEDASESEPAANQPEVIGGQKLRRGRSAAVSKFLRGEYLPNYDEPPPAWDIPPTLHSAFGCTPFRRVHGARMIFRRSVFDTVRFDAKLRRYAYLEDNDFGFRAGRLGPIVHAPRARLCHLIYKPGRIDRRRVSEMAVINGAYLTRKNADDPERALRQLKSDSRKRSILEVAKDLKRRQWALPGFRGTWAGVRVAGQLGRVSGDELDAAYSRALSRLLGPDQPKTTPETEATPAAEAA